MRKCRMGAACIHTGCASDNTTALSVSGNAFGVRTSTGHPKSACNPFLILAISSKEVSGVVSTRRSRSLPSVSSPRRTEPKTRAFTALFVLTMRWISARLASNASEGLMQSVFPQRGHCIQYIALDHSLKCGHQRGGFRIELTYRRPIRSLRRTPARQCSSPPG